MARTQKKVALITGGNRGIGYATVIGLLKQNFQVVFTARKASEGESAVDQLHRAMPGAEVQWLQLDLADFNSVRNCAQAFLDLNLPLHVLIDNAGLMGISDQVQYNQDGFDLMFATNHLGHFLLTYQLLPELLRSAPARVLVVSSRTHIPGYGTGPDPDFDFDNLKAEKYFEPHVFYKNSKLANIWFVYELARRLEGSGVTVNAVCPGWIPQTIGDRMDSPLRKFLFKQVLARLKAAHTPQEGAQNTIYAAIATELEGMSGKFIADELIMPSSEASYDETQALRLWNLSCEWLEIPSDWGPSTEKSQPGATHEN